MARGNPEEGGNDGGGRRRPWVQAVPGAEAWAVLVAIVLLAGCQGEDPPPERGAKGPALIHQWNDRDGRPLTVLATSVHQEDAGFTRLRLEPVLIRLPFETGVIYIEAISAHYDAAGDPTVILEGPLRISGAKDGEALIGRASKATLDRSHRLHLTDLELIYHGNLQTSAVVLVEEHERISSPTPMSSMPAPAAIRAVLGALPMPLPVPELQARLLDRGAVPTTGTPPPVKAGGTTAAGSTPRPAGR